MNCQNAQNSLSAYLDRELSGDAMYAVRSHLEQCQSCHADLESLRAVKSALVSLPVIEPREGLAEDVMRMVRGNSASAPRMPLGVMVATSVAAALLALVLFNVMFGSAARPQYAEDSGRFDAASDGAVTAPDFGGHAPLIPVGR